MRKLKHYLRRNFLLPIKWVWYLPRTLKHKGQIILVYSMGKVGSSSVYATLKSYSPFSAIFHAHFLSDHWLEELLPKTHTRHHWNIPAGKKILQYLEDNPQKRVKIITLVRDPVAFEISNLFQNWRAVFNTENLNSISIRAWNEHLQNQTFEYPLTWFDTEFKNFTRFDIYSQPFDKEKGYSFFRLPEFDIICIQLEKINECFSKAFHDLLGVEFKSLKTTNQSKKKEVFKRFGAIKKDLKLSDKQEKIIFHSRFIQHFYSGEQVDAMRQKWLNLDKD